MHFALMLLASASLADADATIDCKNASKADERAICASADLKQKDDDLAYLYETALSLLKGDARRALVVSERQWLDRRAQCGADSACLQSAYDRRIAQLQDLLPSARREARVNLFRRTGQCSYCDLSGALLSGMNPAQHADDGLLECNITGTARGNLDGARIDRSNFVTCLTKEDSALDSMTWDDASMKGTDLSNSNLGGNSFDQADLTGANLSGANLYRASLEGAILAKANLSQATSPQDAMNGFCANLANANLSGARLEKADICADFRGANFTGADMRGSSISGYVAGIPVDDSNEDAQASALSTFSFGGKVNLTGADLRGATLFGETKLSDGGYKFAILCRTVMPDGTTSNRDCG